MSFRSRKAKQRYSNAADRKPIIGRPITNTYSPLREIACSVVNAPYGETYVGNDGSHARSHEMRLDGSHDASCYIDRKTAYEDRQQRQLVREC